MTKKIAAIGLIFSLLCALVLFARTSNADTPSPNNAEESYMLSQGSIFYLRVLGSNDTASSTGTGVILSSGGTAVTAYHVVKGAQRMEGVMADGTIVSPIKVVNYNEDKDVAILELPDPRASKVKGGVYPFLPMRKEAVKHGESVFAVGYPLKNTPIITEGIVNSPDAEINGRSRILTSSQVVSGMSGGPLLDQRGQLAGIISGSLRTMTNIHLVINMDDVRSLLPSKLK